MKSSQHLAQGRNQAWLLPSTATQGHHHPEWTQEDTSREFETPPVTRHQQANPGSLGIPSLGIPGYPLTQVAEVFSRLSEKQTH